MAQEEIAKGAKGSASECQAEILFYLGAKGSANECREKDENNNEKILNASYVQH